MYADNLPLHISDLSVSTPTILEVLERFNQISGYKINLDKNELMPINSAARNTTLPRYPSMLPWKNSGMEVIKTSIQEFFQDRL